MKLKPNHPRSRSTKRGVLLAATVCVTGALLAPTLTNAAFNDSTYAATTAAVQTMAAAPPVNNDQSAASALFIDKLGRLFISGNREYGNGAGGTPAPNSPPTLVNVGDAVIVDAAGSSNDFKYDQPTAYMALDTEGKVWTWGKPYNDVGNLGRGANLPVAQSYTAGVVTTTASSTPLPPIVDIERAENQFYALDATGTLWTWGYQNENLARPNVVHHLPSTANTVTTGTVNDCTSNASTVKWHSIWGGNNGAAGVAENGLIYTWGYDSPGDVTNHTHPGQRCPRLNEAANRALFAAYPDIYMTNNDEFYNASEPVEANRKARYDAIVSNMQGKVLSLCEGVSAKKTADTLGCPIRQFGFSARAPQLLLANGDLYTWKITSANYGDAFLGRDLLYNATTPPPNPNTSTASNPNLWYEPGNVYHPTVVLQNVDYVSQGVSAITALTRSGEVYGWGANNLCQAVGVSVTQTSSCAANAGGTVIQPTLVANIPADATITRLGSTQCATWAEAEDGRMWAWGAGFSVGHDYRLCIPATSPLYQGHKIFNTLEATGAFPFGKPVEAYSTGTIRVR